MNSILGKISYGFAFCVLVPLTLIWWGSRVPIQLSVSFENWWLLGWLLLITGLTLTISAIYALWAYGKGLPMNAYPPAYFVQRGAYRLFRHPIYVGFCTACAGVSVIVNSPSGLFLITPIVILLCCALVLGYEGPELTKRFDLHAYYPLFDLPASSQQPARLAEKMSVAVFIFGSWMGLYEAVLRVGFDDSYFDTFASFEKKWSIVPWAVLPYVIVYPFTLSAPFVCSTKRQLRDFSVKSSLVIAVGIFMQFVFPFFAQPKPIASAGIFESMIEFEKSINGPAAPFPSFQVLWAFVAANCWANFNHRWKWFAYFFATVISWSCIAIGVHSLLDVSASLAAWFLILYHHEIGTYSQRTCEKIANSWRAWQFGRLRLINHSFYAGLAGMSGILLASLFINDVRILIVITLTTLLGGAVWGWWIEGSSKLLRPFGYYGALMGGVAGVVISNRFFGYSAMNSLAVFALASPAIQSIGRFRCLVQGCCHGRIAPAGHGIVYWNEHSRVCKISGLRGRPIYNTQLYSIISNLLIGAILWRLWYGQASTALITGLYFILSGAARFVEEQYRGEVQTQAFYGLPIYQWLAICSIISGIIISTIPSGVSPSMTMTFGLEKLFAAGFAFLTGAFAMGMDFPKSNIPFSRLSG